MLPALGGVGPLFEALDVLMRLEPPDQKTGAEVALDAGPVPLEGQEQCVAVEGEKPGQQETRFLRWLEGHVHYLVPEQCLEVPR
jgi:hypothetical protein